MNAMVLAASIVWLVLYVYSLAGSVDFGAGFWEMAFPGRNASEVAARYVGPFWEITNVFLIMLAVAIVGFFPGAAFDLGAVLLVPGSLILVLLALRGAFLVYSYTADRHRQALRVVAGVTGILVPALLVSVLPVSAGGYVALVNGFPQLNLVTLFTSPNEYAFVLFGLTMELFFSALFLAGYARKAGDEEAYGLYRKHALWLGPVNLVLAALVTLTLPPAASWLAQGLVREWPLFGLSLVAFAVGYWALFRRGSEGKLPGSPRMATAAVAVQLGLATLAFGLAHAQYMIYPYTTLSAGFTDGTMFGTLLIVTLISLVLFLPGFIWYWRLFVSDRTYVAHR